MATKLPTIQTFMTPVDVMQFSIVLKEHIQSVKFIKQYIWPDKNIPIFDQLDVEVAENSNFCIIDTNILSIECFKNEYIAPHPAGSGYMGGWVGEGLIQFLGSKNADYAPDCLRNGRLAASYDPIEDPETDKFVKTVWKLFKKGAKKLYFIDRETGKVQEKPETRFFAWPDAAKKFNGENGHYLTNHAFAYFLPKQP